MKSRFLAVLVFSVCIGAPAPVHPPAQASRAEVVRQTPRPVKSPDFSGKKQKGTASYYARRFHGQEMADGTALDLASNAAASKTLPLGTKARVRNLENGKSAVVEIRDRGPYIKGRIIDLTPRTARQLGIGRDGLARVEVEPLDLPEKGDSVS